MTDALDFAALWVSATGAGVCLIVCLVVAAGRRMATRVRERVL